jgi:hypothetical protein
MAKARARLSIFFGPCVFAKVSLGEAASFYIASVRARLAIYPYLR